MSQDTSKLLWWLLGTVVAILVTATAGWASHVEDRLQTVADARIGAASDLAEIRARLESVDKRLERIEDRIK